MEIRYPRSRETPELIDMVRRAGWDHLARALDERAQYGGSSRYIEFVALTDGAVIGYLDGTTDSDFSDRGAPAETPHSYVEHLVVDPSARRTGVGTALLHHWSDYAAGEGCTYLVGVPSEHEGSTRLPSSFMRSFGMTMIEKRAQLHGIVLPLPQSSPGLSKQ